MSDVHVAPGEAQVWVIHSDEDERQNITTSHLGVYQVDDDEYVDVLDTSGTTGKKILFPSRERVLLVTRRGLSEDVYVTVDTALRKPVTQRSYVGDRTGFQLSPGGRGVLSHDTRDGAVYVTDSDSLVDHPIAALGTFTSAFWGPRGDVLYLVGGGALHRLDLQALDLAQPLPPPERVFTLAGAVGTVVLSRDERFAAYRILPAAPSKIALANLATGDVRTVDGLAAPAFSNDGRALIYRVTSDAKLELRMVAPDTGATTPGVVLDVPFVSSELQPQLLTLRDHELAVVVAFPYFGATAYLYDTHAEAVRLIGPTDARQAFERPGSDELWLWEEGSATLQVRDLVGDAVSQVVSGVDSVDYRAVHDELVVGSFTPSLRRLAMATRMPVGRELVLPNPLTLPAPYVLAEPTPARSSGAVSAN